MYTSNINFLKIFSSLLSNSIFHLLKINLCLKQLKIFYINLYILLVLETGQIRLSIFYESTFYYIKSK